MRSLLKSRKVPLLYTIEILLFLLITILAFNPSIWADEVFSMKMIEHSYAEMIQLTASDVHPPLYYFILKIFVDIFSFSNISAIYVGKIVSIIPLALTVFYLGKKVKDNFGFLCSAIFGFCIICMPKIIDYALEIRMYSWGLFFVTASFLYAYDIITKKTVSSWIFFTIYSLLAAYTHYFSLISVAVIYVYLFIVCLRQKQLIKWLICSAVTVIAYFPWLIVVINQLTSISGNYWIEPININTIIDYIFFPFKEWGSNLGYIPAIILLCIFVFAIILGIKKAVKTNKNLSQKTVYIIMGFVILAATVLIGIIVSFIIRPIFVERYMVSSLGCFWLCFAYFLSLLKHNKKLIAAISTIIILIGLFNIAVTAKNEINILNSFKDYNAMIQSIDSDDIIISNYPHVRRCTSYYRNNECYLWSVEKDALSHELYGDKPVTINDLNTIENWAKDGKTIWYLESDDFDSLKDRCDNIGLNSEFIGNYKLEFYKINLYEIKSK